MLTGVRVLDLSRVLAGPVCTMMLGDMGASVIKIERPGEGDETRGWGPPFDERGESAYFLSVNRNKLSVAIDLDSEAGLEVLNRLFTEADVVVENFRPGVLGRRGLAPEVVRARYPQLVWCTITGFADEATRPGYDFVVQAESGWMSVTGEPDGSPMKHGVALVDVMVGKDAAIALLAALVERGRTGVGRLVTVSLSATAEAALVNVAQNALVSGSSARRWGNAHANLVPYQLFEASDRAVVIAAGSDAQWLACARALDLAELVADERLRTNAGRLAHRERVVSAIAARVRERSSREWKERLDAVGVPNGVVRTVTEVLAERPASRESGMPPSVPGAVRRRPPLLGEHTDIVARLGWKAFGSDSRTV